MSMRLSSWIRQIMPHRMAPRLFIIICLIGLVQTLALSLVVAAVAGNMLYHEAQQRLTSQSMQTVNVFDQYMDILRQTALNASRQKNIQELISGNTTGYQSYLVYRDAYSYLKNIHEFNNWIHLYVVVNDLNYIMSSQPVDVTGDFIRRGINQLNWYQTLESNASSHSFLSDFVPPVSSQDEQFAFALKIRDIYSWKTMGYIIATIDKRLLHELLQGTNFDTDSLLLVLTETGSIAFDSNPELSQKVIDVRQLQTDLARRSTEGNSHANFYYTMTASKSTGWSFVTFTDRQMIRLQITQLQLIVALVVAGVVVLLIIIARLTAQAYTRPINQLIDFIHTVEKDEYATQINIHSEDEVSDLVTSFNAMVASVRQNQVLRRHAEIDALEKQINPHFLFNTFESIKALAIRDDRTGVILMIERLSDMFRYATNREGSQLVRISDELAHIRNYLDILHVRYGERMQVEFEIDPEALQCFTPRFILQPIVENSISHGLERMSSGYHLAIACIRYPDKICFDILDNGPGMDDAKLLQLRSWIRTAPGTPNSPGSESAGRDEQSHRFGIGLRNIQERLTRICGSDYGLDIKSNLSQGTEVTIQLPIMNSEGMCL